MARTSLLKSIFTVGGLTMVSRVLGLLRETLQSRLIGAGVEQSAFTLAFAIPNMARKLFGEGALTAAFIPLFRSTLEEEGREQAARLARAVMTMVLLLLASVVLLVLTFLVGALEFLPALSPRARLTLSLVAILSPYMLAICGAAFGMGVLNALGKFKASSFMPALLNIIWISTLLALAFFPSLPVVVRVRVVAVAILLGGFAQMAFMLVAMAKAGIAPRLSFVGWGAERVRQVWRNLGVAALGAGAIQVNYMLDQVLGQLASPWAAGVIGYAERLMDLPLGVVGVAFGTVLLPTFSAFFAKGDRQGAEHALATSLRHMVLVMLPASVGLCLLASEVTSVIYEGGRFDALATLRVSRALKVYALSLVFFGVQKSLIPWFQAQKDLKTPLRVSVVSVLVNALLNIIAVFSLPVEWRHVGLAVSTLLCAILGCVLLARAMGEARAALRLFRDGSFLALSLGATLVMALAVLLVRAWSGSLPLILSLAASILAGALAYGLCLLPFRRRICG